MPIIAEGFDYAKVRVIGVTTPTVDFIPDSEGIISYAARVSNPTNQTNFDTADKLLGYCARNKHWSVFEMVNATIEVETTRDIARQLLRHGTMKFQEFSQRYAAAQNFVIRECRMQDVKNRQNSLTVTEDNAYIAEWWREAQQKLLNDIELTYQEALRVGIAKEQARCILPEGNTMSYLYTNANIRTYMHYCQLRSTEGVTQKEHVDMALKFAMALKPIFPSIAKHFDPVS